MNLNCRDSTSQMFRLAFISVFTLRVIFCPMFCLGCEEGAQAAKTNPCTCSDAELEHCKDAEVPTPFDCPCDQPCPCDTFCVYKVTPELVNRVVLADFVLSIDFLPAGFDLPDFSQGFSSCGEELSHRIDLESGRDVRIAHASFLL